MTDIAIADAIPATLTPVPSSPALNEALIASPDRYINRELSQLALDERVLEEATIRAIPCSSGCASSPSRPTSSTSSTWSASPA